MKLSVHMMAKFAHLDVEGGISSEELPLVVLAEGDEPLVLDGEVPELVGQRDDVVLQQTPAKRLCRFGKPLTESLLMANEAT